MSAQPTATISNVTLHTQAHVYFDGKCVSHSFTLPDGSRKSAGVVLPAQLRFNTAAAEVMECVAGHCEYRLADSAQWQHAGPGDRFSVPAQSFFDIRVSQAFHYICHYG